MRKKNISELEKFNFSIITNEETMVDQVIDRTAFTILWQKIEGVLNVPDLYFCSTRQPAVWNSNGWIEAKFAKSFNATGHRMVTLDRFTKGQRKWLIKRLDHGVVCLVMLGVGNEIYLIPPDRFDKCGRNQRVTFQVADSDYKITSPYDMLIALHIM